MSSLGDKGDHELLWKEVWTDHQSKVVALETRLLTDERKMTHLYERGACAYFCGHSHSSRQVWIVLLELLLGNSSIPEHQGIPESLSRV